MKGKCVCFSGLSAKTPNITTGSEDTVRSHSTDLAAPQIGALQSPGNNVDCINYLTASDVFVSSRPDPNLENEIVIDKEPNKPNESENTFVAGPEKAKNLSGEINLQAGGKSDGASLPRCLFCPESRTFQSWISLENHTLHKHVASRDQ